MQRLYKVPLGEVDTGLAGVTRVENVWWKPLLKEGDYTLFQISLLEPP